MTRTSHRHRDNSGISDQVFLSLAIGATMWPDAAACSPVFPEAYAQAEEKLKALLIVAHPDDESECAAVMYRLTHELGAIVDQVVVTKGEGGHRYAGPAEAYYRLPLTNPKKGEKLLARIRREEVLRAGRILGVRNNYFLDQRDTGATLDPEEGFRAWEVAPVKREIRELMAAEQYDLVFLLLPTSDTHGHHQTVAALALEAVESMPASSRPATLGVRTVSGRFSGLNEYPLTRTATAEPAWSFDRRKPLACHPEIDYSVIVNWAIAEHKSQGLFQMEGGRPTHEYFWLFEAGGAAGAARWDRFLQMIGQEETRDNQSHAG